MFISLYFATFTTQNNSKAKIITLKQLYNKLMKLQERVKLNKSKTNQASTELSTCIISCLAGKETKTVLRYAPFMFKRFRVFLIKLCFIIAVKA